MERRYQVFISSTYSDLKEERHSVMSALIQMNCIPAGMELFPASNDEQFEFIKMVIDDCDYYILIIGGRYGSEDYDGVSYTEKEYDYAISKGIPVMSFIHGKPDDIPFGKSESDPQKRVKLNTFKEKVSSNKLIKYWTNHSEIPGQVIISLTNAFKSNPRPGWVRGGVYNNEQLLEQINTLRLENEELRRKHVELTNELRVNKLETNNLAFGDDKVELNGYRKWRDSKYPWKGSISWNELFGLLGPHLIQPKSYYSFKSDVDTVVSARFNESVVVEDDLIQTIKIQLTALGLINDKATAATNGGVNEFINLTLKGHAYLIKIKSVKKSSE